MRSWDTLDTAGIRPLSATEVVSPHKSVAHLIYKCGAEVW
jgi:hypothetical protein